MPTTTQLRIYTIREGLLDEWVNGWRSSILPLRLRFGFRVPAAWVDRERNQFIWVLAYDGPESFQERNAQYWNSPERAALGIDPEAYLVDREVHEVEEVGSGDQPAH